MSFVYKNAALLSEIKFIGVEVKPGLEGSNVEYFLRMCRMVFTSREGKYLKRDLEEAYSFWVIAWQQGTFFTAKWTETNVW